MVKKLLLLLTIIVLAGAAAWYVKSGRRNNPPVLVNSGNEEGNPAESAVTVVPDAPEKTLDLKALSLEIINRSITITASLPESSKQQATAKINELNELIRKDYNDIYQWYDLGGYRKLIGDYDGAIAAWNFGVVIRPDDYINYQNLGDLYAFYLKNYEKGEQNFLKSIRANLNNVSAYQQLSLLYEFSLKDAGRAENILLLGIKENPEVSVLKIELGKYYLRIGRKEEAIKYLEEALALNPDNQALREEVSALKQ